MSVRTRLSAATALVALSGSLIALAPAAAADASPSPSPSPSASTSPGPSPSPSATETDPVPPPAPESPQVLPAPWTGFGNYTSQGCYTPMSDWGWLENATAHTLTATVPAYDSPLTVEFRVWDIAAPQSAVLAGPATKVSDKGVASFELDATKFLDGHSYAWSAVTKDAQGVESDGVVDCHFRIDRTAPTSVSLPYSTRSSAPHVAGWSAQFEPTDPAPADGSPSQMACAEYRLTDDEPWSDPQCYYGLGYSVYAKFKAPGYNTIHVRAVDHAGNRSPEAQRTVFVYPDTGDLDLPEPSNHWQLSRETTGADTTGHARLTATGGVTWIDGDPNRPSVASFDGTGAISSQQAVVDTTKNFTVMASAKPAGGSGIITVASQDGNRSSGFKLWANPYNGNWYFSMGLADDDNARFDDTTVLLGGNTVKWNAWQRLIASYNATSGAMELYVDGKLVASGYHSPASRRTANGPLRIGQAQYQGHADVRFRGAIGNVSVLDRTAGYPYEAAAAYHYGELGPWAGSAACMGTNAADHSAAGSAVRYQRCDWATNMTFSWNWPDGTVRQAGKCLDVAWGGTANGSAVILWDCNGQPNQQWLARADSTLWNPASGRCVDLPNVDLTYGKALALWDCNGQANQRWSAQHPMLGIS